MHFRDFARTKFPTASAPNDDPSKIEGNVALEDKQLAANIMAYHVASYPGSTVFGHSEAKGLKVAEVWVKKVAMGAQGQLIYSEEADPEQQQLEAQTVLEITVEEGMLNVHGILAGPCAAIFIDVATFAPLFVLSLYSGVYSTGVSMSLHTVWHAPAFIGTELRLVSTTLSQGGRTSASRCEVYDKKTKQMLISATQTIGPPPRKTSSDLHRDSRTKL